MADAKPGMKIVAATQDLVPLLLARVSVERQAAMATAMGGDPAQVITDSITRSSVTWCAMDDQGPAWLGGAEPIPGRPGCGYVWQTITPALEQHKEDYLLASRAVLHELHAVYRSLYTLIEASNDAALRHVLRLGGTVGATVMKGSIPMRLCERGV